MFIYLNIRVKEMNRLHRRESGTRSKVALENRDFGFEARMLVKKTYA